MNKKTFEIINVSDRIPNLVILGAQKCGTTSLYNYLSKHPEIACSSPLKEPGYFIFDDNLKKYWKDNNGYDIGSKDFLKLKFMSDMLFKQKYFCDASTYYTQEFYEDQHDIPLQISTESPEVKLIYIIRNPFERLQSVYYHMKRKGVSYPLNRVDDIVGWGDNFLKTSLYYDRINKYFDVFDKNQILILQMEDFKKDMKKEMNKVFNFLDIKKVSISDETIHNKTSPDKREKFNIKTYKILLPLFNEQQNLLAQKLGVSTSWDLSEDKWVN
ncbi:sulfotransferase domain-containing protein [Mangrovimonas sp. CR14]|uniref:sulfotransferase family protein n=1 Tax=Mangrovimonas sp. CR14 TaxID=2706120 RepID=UPI00197D410E|nr:sulfotransferase [Mangrovimonas sp. CR14]NIK91367.1 sulfotransferase domain-containing protein [Mangrovimonas sp. CR14]